MAGTRVWVTAVALGIGGIGFGVGYFPEHQRAEKAQARAEELAALYDGAVANMKECEDARDLGYRQRDECLRELAQARRERDEEVDAKETCERKLRWVQMDLDFCRVRSR